MLRKVLLTLLGLLIVVVAFTGPVDEISRDTAEQAFRRALVTFAIARTLNGVISVAQGTEVAVEPAGVGVNFAPGEVLDPINDLVERFSSVMLVATSALGAQNILLRISAWPGISVLVGLAVAVFLVFTWLGRSENNTRIAWRVMVVVMALRFAVPVIVIGTGLVFDTFLEAEHAKATQALQKTSEEIRELNADTNAPELPDSVLGRIGAFIDDSLDQANLTERFDSFRERMAGASEHIINLIVVFTLQTIVIPIAFLWLLVQGLRRLIEPA
ncbi:MAG: hypothetical protein HKN49_00275 [Gammaproteobacteria bacterium]|nr:hypothetical protein [Gammaproteobacteria bacterium]